MKPKAMSKMLVFAAVALIAGCSAKNGEAGKPVSETEKPPESRVTRGTNGEVLIRLDLQTQKAMALETTNLTPAQLSPEIKAFGRVLDVSLLASHIAELAAAEATSRASQSELERLKTLASQNNTSQRSLQAASAAALRDQAVEQAARLRLLANWGSAIAARQDLPAFVQSLILLSNALVQLNPPLGETLDTIPTQAVIVTLSTNVSPIEAQFIGLTAKIEAPFQTPGFLFLVSPNRSGLLPGAPIEGYIRQSGNPRPGVLLPRQTVVRFNGAAWVYRQISGDSFARTKVELEHPLPDGWFVGKSLNPQDKIVTVGAQLLLSEELKGAGID